MATSGPADNVTPAAADTIELLETRLRRIEYLLTGDSSWSGESVAVSSEKPISQRDSVTARLASLENELNRLSGKVPAVRDMLRLYSLFPDLFQSPDPASSIPSTLGPQALTSMILSYATAFPETASRLTSLQDLPVPDANSSASLIELQPRLERIAKVQAEQAREIAELRSRSAVLAERWMAVGIVAGGEVWGEWEGRVEDVERGIRRREVGRERDGE